MPLPRFTPIDLIVNYDTGKTFKFYEIPSTTYGQPSYQLEDSVFVNMNMGSGLQRVFTGKVKQREHVGENHNEGIMYTAVGMPQLADEVEVRNILDQPEYRIPGTRVVGTGSTTVAYLKTVRQAITEIFSVNGDRLIAAGIPVLYSLSGISDAYIYRDLTLTGGFFSAIKEIAAFDPGSRPIFDDDNDYWRFVNVLRSPTIDMNVNSVNLKNHSYNISTSGCYTSLRLMDDGSIPLQSDVGTPVDLASYQLDPLWIRDLEASWTKDLGSYPLLADGVTYNPFYDVYRTFRVTTRIQVPYGVDVQVPITGGVELPLDGTVHLWFKPYVYEVAGSALYQDDGGSGRRLLETIVSTVYAPYRFTSTISNDPFASSDTYNIQFNKVRLVDYFGFDRLVSVEAGQVIPLDNGGLIVRASEPLAWGDVDFPGAALSPSVNDLPPTGIFATWFYAKRVTTVPIINVPYITYPTSGTYYGTAFSLYGIQRQKSLFISRDKMTEAYAKTLLDLYSEPSISGNLPIEGDILKDFINLDRRVRLFDSTKQTGIQSVYVPVVAFTYTFGKTGMNNLQLSSENQNLVRV